MAAPVFPPDPARAPRRRSTRTARSTSRLPKRRNRASLVPFRPPTNAGKGRSDMDYKKLSIGLGVFSLALGAAELLASKRITGALEADGHEGLVKGFGAREVAAGVTILSAPAASANIWNRVLGDAMDLAALGLAARNAPRNRAVWGTARGLDEQTGKFSPAREGA